MPKFRVILPVDIGDGQVHNCGEVIELDLKRAMAYSHALIAVGEVAGELARVIREIRKRRGLTTTKFGKLLDVTNGQISRYESGKAVPGYFPLWQLLPMADGAEKNPILNQLALALPWPIENPSEDRLRSEFRKFGFTVPGDKLKPAEPADATEHGVWDAIRERTPHLAELVRAVSQLCERKKEVDPSLVKILRLWLLSDDSDPAVRQRFTDAATYLEVGLASKVERDAEIPRSKPKKMA